MKSSANKYLTVGSNVVLNDALDSKIAEIDHYWEGRKEMVTSGVRDANDQIRIIRKYLTSKGLSSKYPEAMTGDVKSVDPETGLYKWQMGWSALLNIGVIINPPFTAVVLMDYLRNGKNKKGQSIGQSPHTRGTAFDISGLDSAGIVKQLKDDGKIRNYLIERENNAIHIDI